MRAKGSFIAVALTVLAIAAPGAQEKDADRSVKGGGIMAKGWQGKIGPNSASQGRTINDSKFEEKDGSFHIAVGAASTYWNPANTATGDYSVGATFTEPKIAAGHPHPYGVLIAGVGLDGEKPSYVYCLAQRDGSVIVRGFSEGTVFHPLKEQPNAAVHKAGEGGSVKQDIAWTVKGDKADCSVNGTVVASFAKADLVGAGKLPSLDGVYGIRAAHNVDIVVSNLAKK